MIALEQMGDLLTSHDAVRAHAAYFSKPDTRTGETGPDHVEGLSDRDKPIRLSQNKAKQVTPHLLPLSKTNQADVPHEPKLHSYIAWTGGTFFLNYLYDQVNLDPWASRPNGMAFSWDPDLNFDPDNPDDLDDHPLLKNAFA